MASVARTNLPVATDMTPIPAGQILEQDRETVMHTELPYLRELQHTKMTGRVTKCPPVAHENLHPVMARGWQCRHGFHQVSGHPFAGLQE